MTSLGNKILQKKFKFNYFIKIGKTKTISAVPYFPYCFNFGEFLQKNKTNNWVKITKLN